MIIIKKPVSKGQNAKYKYQNNTTNIKSHVEFFIGVNWQFK